MMRAFSQAEGRIAEDPEAGRPRSVAHVPSLAGRPVGTWKAGTERLRNFLARARAYALCRRTRPDATGFVI